MMPRRISKEAYSPAAVELRQRRDKERRLLGGSRREGLKGLVMSIKGKKFDEASIAMVDVLKKP